GGDFSFVLTSWGQGLAPGEFGLSFGYNPAEPVFHTILDRTLIRAGETVHMKHVYRTPTVTGYRSGGTLKGTLVLQHRGSDTSYALPLTLGADGIGETEWAAPKEAPAGDYDIKVKVGEEVRETRQSFRLDEYRLPTMRASVEGPKTRTARPRRVALDLYAGYLSGGGAGGAPVKLRTEYEALSDNPDGWEDWTFGGAAVREGTFALDEEESETGKAHLPSGATLPLNLGKEGALRTEIDVLEIQDSMRLRVEMDYEDANGETLTAATSVPLYASAVRLGIREDGDRQRSGEMRLKVVALDLDGKVLRGQPVEVQLYTREILSARRRLIGGFYAFDNSAKVSKLGARCSGVTDEHGLVECTLAPGVSGQVLAMATTRDRDGNEAHAVSSIYVAGDDEWWFGGDNGDRMDIIPDAKSYHMGDTARVQVRMPFREATALVTVEREGVLSSFVTTISGKDPVVEVPMAGSYAPDAYISVLAVRGRVAGWRLWLAEFAKKWNLPFFADPSQPTALVDLAKPAYRLGMTKVKVGWEAHELKVVVKPDRERYHVRDTARVAVQVTGPGGRAPASAEIAFAAVDEGLLALSPNDSWDLLEAMMEERPLSVLTSTAQMQVVGKRHYGKKALPVGGGGGGDVSSLARSDFRPLLVWKGRVPLDAQGRGTVEVPLAEALSAYRLVAVATAGDDLFGTGSAGIRTVQDLTIFSGVPPLVRVGDAYDAVFTLRNSTERDMKVTASADVAPAAGTLKPQTVTVPAGGAVPVTWRVTAPETEQLKWIVTARVNGAPAADKVEIAQQVVPPVPEETWAATFLRLSPGLRVPVAAPDGALPGRGGIEVALTASPAPSLTGVRAYMQAYPYGCFEQRLSKAIALDDAAAWQKQMADLPA
ncbi:MAG: alpha-2-macroglobulin, partial [Sphingomonadales bacterium]|nr:alpha-2-macroglobulin [Sphingomonadales bacterium]